MANPPAPVRRRFGLARTFSRLKNALRRRRPSSTPTTTAETPDSAVREPSKSEGRAPETTTSIPEVPTTQNALDDRPADNNLSSTTTAATTEPDPATEIALIPVVESPNLEIDGEQLDDDVSHSPIMAMTVRVHGLGEERARVLFEKYGLKIEQPASSKEGDATPAKVGRVEKSVRIRVHWTCHSCKTQFGGDKTCTNCGHRRCGDCSRSPMKRTQELLSEVRVSRQQRRDTAARHAVADQQAVLVSTSGDAANAETVAIVPVIPVNQAVLPQTDTSRRTAAALDPAYPVVPHRTALGVDFVFRPKAPPTHRTCHECNAPFTTDSPNSCASCGHVKCDVCPRHPGKARADILNVSDSDADLDVEQPPRTVVIVQRVYKKPRQRVRWQCDECQTMFVDRDVCRNCGHERCQTCVRFPARRRIVVPDPFVVQSVNEKLAMFDQQFPDSPEAGPSTAFTNIQSGS